MGRTVHFFREHQAEVLVFAGAFLVRAAYAVIIEATSGAHGFISFSDAEFFYYQAALNLLEHHAFSIAQDGPFLPDAYHTILYPLFLAVLLWLRLSLLGVVVVQDAVAALTCSLIYRSAVMLTGSRRIALGAAVLAALEPMSIYWSGLLMSDVLFAFLITAGFYFLIAERPYLSSGAVGLAMLVRPVAFYFVPVFVAMIAYRMLAREGRVRVACRTAAVALAVAGLVALPWYVRNKIVFDRWSLSGAGWFLVYNFPLQEFSAERGVAVPPVVVSSASGGITRFDFVHGGVYKQAALSAISHDPLGFALVYARRSAYSLVSDRYWYLVNVVMRSELPGLYQRVPGAVVEKVLIVGKVFWWLVYALCLLGFAEPRLRPWWLFSAVLIGFNAILSGGINPAGTDMSRYMLPFHLSLFLFAAIGAQLAIARLRQRRPLTVGEEVGMG